MDPTCQFTRALLPPGPSILTLTLRQPSPPSLAFPKVSLLHRKGPPPWQEQKQQPGGSLGLLIPLANVNNSREQWNSANHQQLFFMGCSI